MNETFEDFNDKRTDYEKILISVPQELLTKMNKFMDRRNINNRSKFIRTCIEKVIDNTP